MRRRTFGYILPLGCLWSACATVSVAVDPGHGAVLTDPNGNMSILGEGVAYVSADARVDDFDLTQQSQGGSFAAVTKDGVPLRVVDPVVGYRVIAEELVEADRTLGPTGWKSVVEPIVSSTIGRVVATYRYDQLDTPRLREAQDRITTLAAAQLKPLHIALLSVELKGLVAQLPGLASSVTETSVWEQRSAKAKTSIEVASHEADNLRAKAAGIASANQSIAETLTPATLQNKADQAWLQLITSPTTDVEVVDSASPPLEVSP
jgi:hypothetical protein